MLRRIYIYMTEELKFHTLRETARLFEQCYETVVRLAKEGYIKTVRPFGRYPVLVPDSEVRRFLSTPGAIRKRGRPFVHPPTP
jgi:hypothetical protein